MTNQRSKPPRGQVALTAAQFEIALDALAYYRPYVITLGLREREERLGSVEDRMARALADIPPWGADQ